MSGGKGDSHSVQIESLDAQGRTTLSPLPLSRPGQRCSLRLRTPAGAGALQVVLRAKTTATRFEVEADENEELRLGIEWDPSGEFHLLHPERKILRLPPDEHFRAADPFQPHLDAERLDLILLIDGTTRHFDPSGRESGRLLDNSEAWKGHVDQLLKWLDEVSRPYASTRVSCFAFADRELRRISAADLAPSYLFHPRSGAQRALAETSSKKLKEILQRIPGSSGGDFVDALAEALDECLRTRWRPDSRRLILLSGDSPGYSILHPIPWGANAGIRRLDVDSLIRQLHDKGVELVTIYHPAPLESGLHDRVETAPLLEFAHQQYQRVASRRRDYFHVAPSFDPEQAARAVLENDSPLGRGASLGTLVAVDDADA